MNWSKFSLMGMLGGIIDGDDKFDEEQQKKILKKKLEKCIKKAKKETNKKNKQEILFESITPDDIQILKRILIIKVTFLIEIKKKLETLKINYNCIRDISFIIDNLCQIRDSALTRSTPMYNVEIDDHNLKKEDITNKEIVMSTETKYIYSFLNLLETINGTNIKEDNIDLNFIKELSVKVERFVEHFINN